MHTFQIISGIGTRIFDKVRATPLRKIVPNGSLIVEPARTMGTYDPRHTQSLLRMLNEGLAAIPESEPVAIQLLYVDYNDQSTAALLQAFYPFALVRRLPLPCGSERTQKFSSQELSNLLRDITRLCADLRYRAALVRGFTYIANLSPLLLPLSNFKGNEVERLLAELYSALGQANDPSKAIKEKISKFLQSAPLVTPPGSDRHCFSDGTHYFQSPGKERHAFFRNSNVSAHEPWCLPRARARLGGAYDYRFHFDVIPVRGGLSAKYPTCHGPEQPPSKPTHVNVAPNDYTI